jgi:hypothetical protein
MAQAVLDEITGDYVIVLHDGEHVTQTIRSMINLLSIQHTQWLGTGEIMLVPNLVGYGALGDATCYKDKELADNLAQQITRIGEKVGLTF